MRCASSIAARLAAEIEARIRAAIDGGHLPEQDARLAARGLLGALLEGLIGPLAPEDIDDPAARRAKRCRR